MSRQTKTDPTNNQNPKNPPVSLVWQSSSKFVSQLLFFFSLKIRPISTGIFGRELPAMSQRPLQGEEAHPMFGFASRWSQNPYKCPLKGNKALLFWGEPGIGGVGPPRFSRKRRVAYCLVGCLHFRWLPLEFIGWSPESGCTRPSYFFRIIQSSR